MKKTNITVGYMMRIATISTSIVIGLLCTGSAIAGSDTHDQIVDAVWAVSMYLIAYFLTAKEES